MANVEMLVRNRYKQTYVPSHKIIVGRIADFITKKFWLDINERPEYDTVYRALNLFYSLFILEKAENISAPWIDSYDSQSLIFRWTNKENNVLKITFNSFEDVISFDNTIEEATPKTLLYYLNTYFKED